LQKNPVFLQQLVRDPSAANFINILLVHFLYKILAPKITKPNATRGKLPKRLLYKKGPRKTLMKLTPADKLFAPFCTFLLNCLTQLTQEYFTVPGVSWLQSYKVDFVF